MNLVPVSAADPRLAPFRNIRDADMLRTRGLFVAEGRTVVERVLADQRFRVESLLLNRASFAALEGVLQRASPDVTVYVCETRAFPDITGVNLHRGCLGLVQRPLEIGWRALAAGARLLVVLEAVADADNVGGVFRNAAAFGADGVLLSPTCCDPLYRKAVRTSMAATLRVPFARIEPWPEALRTLHVEGFTIAALSPREPALSIDAFAASRPARVVLLVGTEGGGLSAAAEQAADVRVRIPIGPAVDSLNLAVAAGIALSRLSRGL